MRKSMEPDKILKSLNTIQKIQDYLNNLPYDEKKGCRSPFWAVKEGKAHCFEGALIAAACLEQIGYKPLIVDMVADNDDDHVIAVFKKNNRWGAIAKSNFTTLRFREPVYLTIRELIMSYFDLYFNTKGEKTLREYSEPFDLSAFEKDEWKYTESNLDYMGDALAAATHHKILNKKMISELLLAEEGLIKGGLIGSNPHGLFKPN